ncbi:HEAT repeat domain-containing protein [Promethearchaeum syntrophicum]|uniref:HEAT repeat domain-containing protein n=1 Tax=Promethearchaeum syntrophicum TaxID=2594042 RepID=A0A5B9D7Q0_9ARCH|nr:HEAT repeat domain-containing protein [Candidatus Prometheoarchaeum syntrophicum]QEE15025.1 HEAT repeat protein [Candidatus Prometheoarchaeum syntrophicum]
MGIISELFNLSFKLNGYTIVLMIIYIGTIAAGYNLMAKQVKLVKKEIWDNADRFKSFIWGFYFGNSVIIIVTIMMTFLITEIEKNKLENPLFETALGTISPFIIFPLLFCLLFISIYPLADLLYMASGENAMTPLQKPYKKIIDLVPKPYTYIIAVLLYFVAILLPPLLLISLLQIEVMISWISWALIYPIVILTYYGVLGFMIVLGMTISKIPSMERSTFLAFDSSKRANKEFLRDPLNRILYGLLIFVYIFQFYAFIRNIVRLDPNFWTEPSPHWYDVFNWMIYLSLGISITVYFSRFWGRKIKFKTMDILFASFLIAAVGINVLTTYTVSFYYQFESIYTQFSPTAVYYNLHDINSIGFEVGKYSLFTLASNIEETVLIIGITYFLFFEKNRKYWKEILYGQITQSLEVFNPVPSFNMLSKDDIKLREHSKNVLKEMYDRLPIRKGYDLNDPVFRDSLFDAICHPSNLIAQETSKEILGNLMENYPKKTLFMLKDVLNSKNFDKVKSVLDVILKHGNKILPLMDSYTFFILLNHPDYRIRNISIEILDKQFHENILDSYSISPTEEQISLLIEHLENPDHNFQSNVLQFLSKHPNMVPQEVFSSRLDHSITKIRSIAAKASSTTKFDDINQATIPKLIEMMDSANPEIKISVFSALTKIGHFNENKIPIEPFISGLLDQNNAIRNAAVEGVLTILKEQPYSIKSNYILSIIDSQDVEIQQSLLKILEALWKQSFITIFPKMIKFVHSENSDLQKLSQKILVNMGLQDPKLLVSKLVIEPDTESFIQRGKISETIIKISKSNPKRVIPIMIENLTNEKDFVRLNVATVLSELSSIHPEEIPLDILVNQWSKEEKIKISKELTNCISNISNKEPLTFKFHMNQILETFSKSNSTLRLIIAKLFIDIAEKNNELLPFDVIQQLTTDEDSYIREIGIKIIGFVGRIYPKKSITIIQKGLKDPDWNVKNAATDAFNKIGSEIESEDLIYEIKSLLKDENKWTRLAALEMIINYAEKNQSIITLNETLNLINLPGSEEIYLYNLAKLLGIVGTQDFKQSFPEMINLMKNPSKKVREGMISGMVKLSNVIDNNLLIPKLLFYFSDETDMKLQQSVALVFKRIMKYETGEIKQRVLSVLSIRAGVSQDPILLSVLSELQD